MVVIGRDEQGKPLYRTELVCPNCNRDLSKSELFTEECLGCGKHFDEHKENVQVMVASLPAIGMTW